MQCAIVAILLVSISVPSQTSGTLMASVVRLAEDLMQDPSAVRREFWFLNASKAGYFTENLLIHLIESEPFASQPKLLLTELGAPDRVSTGIPTLVVVFLDQNHPVIGSPLYNYVQQMDVQIKLVVIFLYQSHEKLVDLVSFFVYAHLFNVVYITVFDEPDKFEVFNFIAFRNMLNVLQQYDSAKQVFPEQNDFVGMSITVCTTQAGLFSSLNPISRKVEGFDMELVILALERMHANVSIEFIECQPDDDRIKCLKRQGGQGVCKFNFGRFMLDNAEYGVPVLPMHSIVIVVPRGTPINVLELLAAPYSQQSWNVLLWTTIGSMILIQFLLKRPAVNIFMLLICGLEDSTLNRRKSIETLLTTGFIILFFLLLSAYEAKIISFLSTWPHKPDLVSMEDLRDEQIAVLSGAQFIPNEVFENPWLRHLIRHVNFSNYMELFTAVRSVGFITDQTTARIVLQKQLNIDPRTSRTRFVMLKERLATQLMFHYFGARHTMRARFAVLQQRIYEAGFMEYWMSVYAASQSIQTADLAEQTPRMIMYEQLQQLKGVFFVLWGFSVVVFSLELMTNLKLRDLIVLKKQFMRVISILKRVFSNRQRHGLHNNKTNATKNKFFKDI